MKNLSLTGKFVSILSIFVVASIAIATLGIFKLAEINHSLDTIVNDVSPRLIASKDIKALVADIKNQEKVFIMEDEKVAMAEVGHVIEGFENTLGEKLNYLKDNVTHPDSVREVAESITLFEQWKVLDREMRHLAEIDKNKEAFELARGPIKQNFAKFDKLSESIGKRNQGMMDDRVKAAAELFQTARMIMIAVSVIAIFVGILLAFFVLRALNSSINAIIAGLKDSAGQVSSAAQQIAASSEELSQGATEQASSLEETSSAVEEMNSMVQRNAESARSSSSVAQASGNSAVRGKKVVDDMKQAMIDINHANTSIMNQTTESNLRISEIVSVIAEIGNKTKVINDIVFQTKLLSFNASVEAARAGEHGKGFAVVAEEVGNLAQMSGNAAKEISNLLDSSINKVQSIVAETKTSVEKLITESKSKVEMGTKVASDCGNVLDEIVRNVNEMNQMSQSISTASDEQARGISEITRAVGQLDQMTQQNAAASEEAASAAEELSAQADSLLNAVEILIVTVKGGENQPAMLMRSMPVVALRAVPKATRTNNVVHLGKSKKSNYRQTSMKMVSGSDVIPTEDDPRFRDI